MTVKTIEPPANQFMTRALQQYGLLSLLYVVLIFVLPPNPETSHMYHLGGLQYHVISFAVALPSLAVWLAAFISYAKLRQYAQYIRKTAEGSHFDELAQGCTWLAWSLPLSTIVPVLLNALADHWPRVHPTAIIVSNYTALLLPLLAFSVIAGAARGLVTDSAIKFNFTTIRLLLLAFITVGVLYCLLTLRRFDLTSLEAGSTANPYFLPLWLMTMTIIIPYLYAWFIGSAAVYEITLFSKQVQGVLYRQALRLLVGGLLAVILSSIALQYISSIEPRIGHLVLDYKLVLTLLCRVIGGGGFVLLAIGANRLKKIEEV
jgi:hypothetical protein